MDISADQVAAIVEALESSGGADPRGRRRATRMKISGKAEISLSKGAQFVVGAQAGRGQTPQGRIEVRVINLSSRGVSVLLEAPLSRGDSFVLHLPRKYHDGVDILCTVSHCEPVQGRMFAVGSEFTCKLNRTTGQSADKELQRIQKSILS